MGWHGRDIPAPMVKSGLARCGGCPKKVRIASPRTPQSRPSVAPALNHEREAPMRRRAVSILVLLVLCSLGGPAIAGDLALKRVMLSTGGVAYLEYEAEVEGDARLTFSVPLDQVDDVLKSIVVYDSKGGIGAASLPGRQPLTQLFNDLPFGPEALTAPA